jgi:hypothetical protein
VKNVNEGRIDNDIPPMSGGSREVRQVYNSFAKLYKIVSVSNTVFFSGSLAWAYHFTSDALELYRKLNDRKAIGIACNNLGNIVLAMKTEPVTTSQSQDEKTLGSADAATALKYFAEAIAIAEADLEAAEWSSLQGECAQHLADRVFNRGMFCLLSQDETLKSQGLDDIARVQVLDKLSTDKWVAADLIVQQSDSYFPRLLRRIHGLVDLHRSEDVHRVWNARDLVREADEFLFSIWDEPAPLFRDIGRAGRRQQLEAAVMRYELMQGDFTEAGRLAMRMFAEDVYLLESPFQVGARALLAGMREKGSLQWSLSAIHSAQADIRNMARSCKNVRVDVGKNLVLALELSDRWEDDPILDNINAKCLMLYDDCCGNEDNVGLVAQSSSGDQSFQLSEKEDHATIQRAAINAASRSISERAFPAFPTAIQLVLDRSSSMDNDSYVVLLVDGFSWDSESFDSIYSQVEQWNRDHKTTINIIILGVDVESDSTIEECKALCTLSRQSLYVDVTLDNIDAAFESVTRILQRKTQATPTLNGITMERL